MTIREELLQIKGTNDLLLAEDVVSWAAKHPSSALYSSLEWNNKKAADKYRLWQARQLIAIHVISEDGDRRLVSLSIDRKDGGGYRNVDDVLPVPSLREILLDDALKELERLQAKYERLTELAKVWEETAVVKKRRRQSREEPRVAV